jgi:membrane-associated phospholipid phosphatase
MTKEQYIKITEPLRSNTERAKRVTSLNHMLTALVFCVYPLYLFMLFVDHNPWLLRAVFVPVVSFVGLTVIRRIINAPRPYETFDIPPVLEKDTKGKSFPSRHVFSVFIIAMTIFYEHPGAGVLLGIIGLLLGLVRVLVGVHEPRDIIAGAFAGIVCGIVGYYVI